jgi:hypothetical protein
MVYIYDISKENAVNSRQIVSTYFNISGSKFKIIVKMATETPNNFEVYERDFFAEVEEILEPLMKKRRRSVSKRKSASKILLTKREIEEQTEQIAKPIFYKFVEQLSNPVFDNSDKPVYLSEILKFLQQAVNKLKN